MFFILWQESNEYYNSKCDKGKEVMNIGIWNVTKYVFNITGRSLHCIKYTREKYDEVWYDDHT